MVKIAKMMEDNKNREMRGDGENSVDIEVEGR